MSSPLTTTFSLVSAFVLASASNLLLLQATTFAAPKNETAILASSKSHENNGKAYGHTKNQSVTTTTQPATGILATSTATAAASITTLSAKPTDHNPSGNNGFIKVNEEQVPDSIPNNDPHVGCTLKVEFYNYDLNPSYRARVEFALQNPTANGRTMTVNGNLNPSIGGDSAGGGNDLDAVETYRLNFTGAPHTQQGYHVKLTIHADGSRGADVKHKVFWVQPCETPTQPGQVLSTSTTTPNRVLPTTLPSTGISGILGSLMTLIASVATYLAVLYVQRLRARA